MHSVRLPLFLALFYLSTAAHVLGAILAAPFGRAPAMRVIRQWVASHGWLARHVAGIQTRVEGDIPAGPHLFAVKHQAMFETIEMVRIADAPVIVMKRELARIPLFGGVTRRYGVIPIERNAGAKALRNLVTEGRKAIAEGRSVIIYPEGTRVPPGTTPPLRSGFAGLYRALGLPVVPVAVDSGRLLGKGVARRGGTITFKVGEIIPSGLGREEIEARVHTAINALELGAAGNPDASNVA